MKRNLVQDLYWLQGEDQFIVQYNFFDRIFETVLLVEICDFISCENNTSSDSVILLNDFIKSFIDLKSSQILHINTLAWMLIIAFINASLASYFLFLRDVNEWNYNECSERAIPSPGYF